MSSSLPPFVPPQDPSSRPASVEPSWNGGARPGWPPQARRRKSKIWLHVLLFVLTIGTTTFMVGPLYSVCVLAILTSHEFGHYFAARHYRVPATLPYFIPFPSILGTLGAVIRMSPYIPNRRALFDIAAAGPIAGLVVAIPVTFVGILLSGHVPEAPEGSFTLGDTLLFRAMEWLIFGSRMEGSDLLLHPVAFAGWVGLFVTALNLLPISQLDGGHINYALFGRRSRMVSAFAFVALLVLTMVKGFHYSVMLILLWFMGISHPPTLNDSIALDRNRRLIGLSLAVVFVLCFSPAPFEL